MQGKGFPAERTAGRKAISWKGAECFGTKKKTWLELSEVGIHDEIGKVVRGQIMRDLVGQEKSETRMVLELD